MECLTIYWLNYQQCNLVKKTVPPHWVQKGLPSTIGFRFTNAKEDCDCAICSSAFMGYGPNFWSYRLLWSVAVVLGSCAKQCETSGPSQGKWEYCSVSTLKGTASWKAAITKGVLVGLANEEELLPGVAITLLSHKLQSCWEERFLERVILNGCMDFFWASRDVLYKPIWNGDDSVCNVEWSQRNFAISTVTCALQKALKFDSIVHWALLRNAILSMTYTYCRVTDSYRSLQPEKNITFLYFHTNRANSYLFCWIGIVIQGVWFSKSKRAKQPSAYEKIARNCRARLQPTSRWV